jgi:hypothetical protein
MYERLPYQEHGAALWFAGACSKASREFQSTHSLVHTSHFHTQRKRNMLQKAR